MTYSIIGILALLVLVIENQDILLNRGGAFEKSEWRTYRRFLLSVIVYYLTDILWGLIEARKLSELLFVDTSVYFIAMAAGVLLWAQYTLAYLGDENSFGRLVAIAGRVIAAMVVGLVVANIFAPVLFVVDEACVYHTCGGRPAVLICQIILLLLISAHASLVIVRQRNEEEKLERYRTLALFGLVMSVFLLLQLWYPYLPLYSVAYMLGTCLIRSFVIGDEKEAYRLRLEETKKVAELRQSIDALLNNMPAMSFSKDVHTGTYLACNQAFADFADKETPEDVVGLTDHEIFDEVTAAHFVEDDQTAIAMSKPYVVSEDVEDASGNPRQFQTTKLKFRDATGRLCLLGMSTDVTEMMAIKRENQQARAAYKEAMSAGAVYESIVDALAEDYFDLYYVDLETDEFVEYGSLAQEGRQYIERQGVDFFGAAERNARRFIYEKDRAGFIEAFTKTKVVSEIDRNGAFVYEYRLLVNNVPTYVSIKATRIGGDDRHIIIGINNIDAQVRDRQTAERAEEERSAYLRLSALSGNTVSMYVVDAETDDYAEYGATEGHGELGVARRGQDFFGTVAKKRLESVHPDDCDIYEELFTKENILEAIGREAAFTLNFRLMDEGAERYARLKAVQVTEDDRDYLIIGVFDVDAQTRREQERSRDLSDARKLATRDALTGVKNKHAYASAEEQLNRRIEEQAVADFAIVVCDVNDLKLVNDTKGHKAGDRYITNACLAICNVFKHSPVFRVGGDEFVVICEGYDYEHVDALLDEMDAMNRRNKRTDNAQIAYGMARYEQGASAESVFERADQRMYEHKAMLKGQRA